MKWCAKCDLVVAGMAGCLVGSDFLPSALAEPQQECVVLIHGLGRTSRSMKRLEWALAKTGYHVINISYPSTRLPVEESCDRHLGPALKERVPDSAARVHFVTHSLGGILLRQYLSGHHIPNLGNVVMLAPPNQGSEVADWMRRSWVGRLILGKSGRQLGTAPEDLPKRLGPVQFRLGVIAGDRSWNPLFSAIIPGPDDGKVSVESTKVEGMNDFIVIHSSHTWIMCRHEPIRQATFYLEHGRFDQPSK